MANCWPKALITKVHPAKDGTVRVVTVKNALGHEHERAVAEVVVLPLSVSLEIQSTNEGQSAPLSDADERRKSPEPNRTKSCSVFRPSPRIFTTNLFSLLLLTFCVQSILGTVIVPKRTFGGAMVFSTKSAWRKQGEITYMIATQMHPREEVERIRQLVTSYENKCHQTGDFAFRMCLANLNVLKVSEQEAVRALEMHTRSRKRRSYDEEGVLLHLWEWLFGTHRHNSSPCVNPASGTGRRAPD